MTNASWWLRLSPLLGLACGSEDYTADIDAFCEDVDICWNADEACVDALDPAIDDHGSDCEVELNAMFQCVKEHGPYTSELECEGEYPCQTEILAGFDCADIDVGQGEPPK